EMADMAALEQTFRMIKAETQLLYSSDYPHWDFDLPSTIYDLPFLNEQAKRNILGGNAIRLFGLKLPARKLARVPEYGRARRPTFARSSFGFPPRSFSQRPRWRRMPQPRSPPSQSRSSSVSRRAAASIL